MDFFVGCIVELKDEYSQEFINCKVKGSSRIKNIRQGMMTTYVRVNYPLYKQGYWIESYKLQKV